MSWLALKKVTKRAAAAVDQGMPTGRESPSPTMAAVSKTWKMSSHPLRRPKRGQVNRSRMGAHKNLRV